MSGIAPALDSLISSGFHQNICKRICIQYLYQFSVFVFVHNEEEKICLAQLQPGFSDLIRLFWLFSSSGYSFDDDDDDDDDATQVF